MSNEVCLLITISAGEYLVKVAVRFMRDSIDRMVIDYPLEPEHKQIIFDRLPQHVQSVGTIVAVEEIMDIIG